MRSFYKPPKYDKQLATAQIILAKCGGCFHGCRCNPCKEKSTYLHYAEMPDGKKDSLEEEADKQLSGIGIGYLKKLSDLDCQAVFFKKDNNILLIRFDSGGFESLDCRIQKNGEFDITPSLRG